MSLIALMLEAARTYETLVSFYHGATTQKTAIFILTAVRTSNPTYFNVTYFKFILSLTRIINGCRNDALYILQLKYIFNELCCQHGGKNKPVTMS
jgi:hypothetical protein